LALAGEAIRGLLIKTSRSTTSAGARAPIRFEWSGGAVQRRAGPANPVRSLSWQRIQFTASRALFSPARKRQLKSVPRHFAGDLRTNSGSLAKLTAIRRACCFISSPLRAARSCHLSIIDRASRSARSRGPVIILLGLSTSAGMNPHGPFVSLDRSADRVSDLPVLHGREICRALSRRVCSKWTTLTLKCDH
jgi:hypothetical protein